MTKEQELKEKIAQAYLLISDISVFMNHIIAGEIKPTVGMVDDLTTFVERVQLYAKYTPEFVKQVNDTLEKHEDKNAK